MEEKNQHSNTQMEPNLPEINSDTLNDANKKKHPRSAWFISVIVVILLVGLSWYGYIFFQEDIIPNPSQQEGFIPNPVKNKISKNEKPIDIYKKNREGKYLFAKEADYEDNGFTNIDTLEYNDNISADSINSYLQQNLELWFKRYAEQGVSILDLPIFNLDGEVLYNSPSLFGAGFQYPEDINELMPTLLGLARKYSIKLMFPIEGFAHIMNDGKPFSRKIKKRKITKQFVQNVIKEIGEYANRYGQEVAINEEAYDSDFIDAIAQSTKENNVEYVHFFDDLNCRADLYLSEDYAYYPRDARNNVDDQKYIAYLQEQGSYEGKLGDLNLMFGSAVDCGADSAVATAGGWGMGSRTHQNISLLRAIQFDPKFFQFIIASGNEGLISDDERSYVMEYDFNKKLSPLLEQFARKSTDIPKKIANIIIDLSDDVSEDVRDQFFNAELSSISPITNALLASGYDLVVTKGTVFPKSDLYYVYSSGVIWEEGVDLPANLADLINQDNPVFFQSAGDMFGENWDKVTERLEMTDNFQILYDGNDDFFEPIPEKVSYKFPNGEFDLKYAGYNYEADPKNIGKDTVGHFLHYIDPSKFDANNVLLTGMTAKDGDKVFDDKTALIIKNKNVYFVNGSHLHLEMSQILANIMSKEPVFNAPSYGYWTTGENRSVFYAPYDVDIDVNVTGGTNITAFDEKGNLIHDSNLKLEGKRLTGHIPRFGLVVIN